jgi:hypothetical protein
MATFRCNPTIVFVLLSLACVARDGAPDATTAQAGATVTRKDSIEPVTPRRDFVGALPTRLEWTAVEGVDSYAITVETEIELPVFDQEGIKTTSVPWPKEARLDSGTYFWRIVAIKNAKIIADSGRSAFVVLEP